MLLVVCGLRLNEARELRLDDLDFDQGIIRIRPETSKFRKGRYVKLYPEAADPLARYVYDFRDGSREYVFLTETGRRSRTTGSNASSGLSDRFVRAGRCVRARRFDDLRELLGAEFLPSLIVYAGDLDLGQHVPDEDALAGQIVGERLQRDRAGSGLE